MINYNLVMAKEYCKKFKKNHPNVIFEEKDDLIKLGIYTH